MDCTSLITVPILTDREIYRHNSSYLKLCKTSGPPVILALPEATLSVEGWKRRSAGCVCLCPTLVPGGLRPVGGFADFGLLIGL